VTGTESMPRSAIQATVVFLTLVLLGCDNQPLTFTGTWRGANSQFSDVTLALTQTGDSVSGTIRLSVGSNPPFGVTITASLIDGDSLAISGPIAPSSGYTSIGFAGRRMNLTPIGWRLGEHPSLTGHVLLGSTATPESVTLVEQ